ncbi:hypothetical protein [Xanthomonas euvesicatoria]|uniref:hypothetical protein n=1 Tax=Xanthomonas euvesicatoria TaxID=456327 RepID=UPI001C457AF6|nr:hypothetical protein [Xanthomonas euvesicatoria]MBV6855888.1 hypothetical protein [Xanthomonas campestris pv. mirabilis]MBV6867869.1 hypothetical protein [Xanthomonas campestris pv. coriandri]MCE4330789.1 hypothetical protein [Xanthomonas campestris pv. coriandri]
MSFDTNTSPYQLDFPPQFDRADNYLLLIDDELKTLVNGEAMIRLDRDRDYWMPLQEVPLEKLKVLAQQSVAWRMSFHGRSDDANRFQDAS